MSAGKCGPHGFSRHQKVRVKVVERGLPAEEGVRFLQQGNDADAGAG